MFVLHQTDQKKRKGTMMRKHTASASGYLVNLLLQYATGTGINLAGLWEAVGLEASALENPMARIPVEQFNTLWHQVALRSGNPHFGLHFAETADKLTTGSVLSSVMMNCATVESALEKLARYHGLTTDFLRLRVHQQGDCAYCTVEPIDAGVSLHRHYSEAVLCSLALTLRRLTQDKVRFIEAHFTHPCPADTAEHQRIFHCPLMFSQPRNELAIGSEALNWPIPLANAHILEQLEQLAQAMLGSLYQPDTWADRVAHQISQKLLQGEKPTLNAVARELAISPRHLQNKLKEEDITFQALLDELRKQAALKYLNERTLTICDIAFLLGFSEHSAFNHAFKRWTGTSPREYQNPGG
jgi:AraC-like DNA-binding protein